VLDHCWIIVDCKNHTDIYSVDFCLLDLFPAFLKMKRPFVVCIFGLEKMFKKPRGSSSNCAIQNFSFGDETSFANLRMSYKTPGFFFGGG